MLKIKEGYFGIKKSVHTGIAGGENKKLYFKTSCSKEESYEWIIANWVQIIVEASCWVWASKMVIEIIRKDNSDPIEGFAIDM